MPKTKSSPAARADQTRSGPVVCAFHHCALDETGWCVVAQAWAKPRFACPDCHGWLEVNGFCASCTPRTRVFPGDYFEGRWDADAGREYGHYVRVHRGPTPAPSPDQVDAFFGELRALMGRVGRSVDEPAWITEDAGG